LFAIGNPGKFKHEIIENSRGGLFRDMSADRAMKADIRNKLQAALTVLELLSEGKEVTKELIEIAKRDLDETIRILERV
jgi:hypothetical protein